MSSITIWPGAQQTLPMAVVPCGQHSRSSALAQYEGGISEGTLLETGLTGLQQMSPQLSASLQQFTPSGHELAPLGQQKSPHTKLTGVVGQHVPCWMPCEMQLWSELQQCLPAHANWPPPQQRPVLELRQISWLSQQVGGLSGPPVGPQLIGQHLSENSQASIPAVTPTIAAARHCLMFHQSGSSKLKRSQIRLTPAHPSPKVSTQVPTAQRMPAAVPPA